MKSTKLSKPNLFVLIWITHLFIYNLSQHAILRVTLQDYNEFYYVLLGFLGGFYGWFEQLPLFFLAPLFLMLLAIKTKSKPKWFLAYTISICAAYLANYLWMFSNNKHAEIFGMPESINLIYFIVPSLLISILCNWLIFKKIYKVLGI
ncbi:MAG: hypothetical protein AAF554_08295 [Bacteroidota bacterium]